MAALLAAVLWWAAPSGTDLAAHVYQRAIFAQYGFQLWNNLWYSGHYSFVTYSILYYPLATLFGIRLLAVATVAVGTFAFAVVVRREWGAAARAASIAFGGDWAAFVLTGAFPFALGLSLALLAVWSLQRDSRWMFGLFAALSLAASPLAFLLLVTLLAGVALAVRAGGWRLAVPALTVAALGGVELLLWRVFPSGARYPFSLKELTWALGFCGATVALTWRVERARALRFIFLAYAAACMAVFLIPSAVGQNMARFRFVAAPVIVLALSLRGWRPRIAAVALLSVAIVWNLSPLVSSLLNGRNDRAAMAAYWQPGIQFLRAHLSRSYRVEVVGTARHWEAAYLPRAGIPITRGWFRQDDFPVNEPLYHRLTPAIYLPWLRSLGVKYVLLTGSRPDYSARSETKLLRSGRSGLQPVLRSADLMLFRVPAPQRLVTGPAEARVIALSQTQLVVSLSAPGTYRVALRYSLYWQTSSGCVSEGKDQMTRLTVPRADVVVLQFRLNPERALDALTGRLRKSCAADWRSSPGRTLRGAG